ncbi:hypothetical protein [Janibacter anophelis]|uniref:hypothetical protein n=1 Tax=Janibacter anophelis TaxID=319054 RepID=UPI0013B056E3|nr:hypothetical protein [Janibacter anophelis]
MSTEQVRTSSEVEIAGIALARRRKGARRARAAAVATDDREALGTAQLGAAFAFAILVAILVDIAVQLNVWRVIGVSALAR